MALSYIPGNMLPHPGYCLSCGVNGIDCVDTGKTEDYYGAVLLCRICFRDGALRIKELGLFDQELHDDMIHDLEEKIVWRDSIEPTVAKLEADIRSAVDTARHGFNQRYITDSSSNEVLSNNPGYDFPRDQNFERIEQAPEQLFFTIGSLQELSVPE